MVTALLTCMTRVVPAHLPRATAHATRQRSRLGQKKVPNVWAWLVVKLAQTIN